MHYATRFNSLPAASPADRLQLRGGALADYAQLAGFHYLSSKPVTATRVLVLEDTQLRPTTQQATAIVGVLIESLPSLACVLRDRATRCRYRGLRRVEAARALNNEVRCISRVVVHPQWRGLGLAVRLVKHALQTATTPYTEAIAAMGQVHPFFELAGMTAYRRAALKRDQRLREALRFAGIEPWELASESRMTALLKDATPQAALLRQELQRWAPRESSLGEQIIAARKQLLCDRVYYLHRNP